MNLAESKLHFVGIGGIGMSGIAEVLVNMGCRVTGSDQALNAQVQRLEAMGVRVFKGHAPSNVPKECDAVVYSSAVKASNPEIVAAKNRKIPIIQRAEMLSELMRLKRGIAIGGSHGKTTTTSMVATVLLSAGLDPTIVIGGRLDLLKSTAALGKGEWLVAEADESDGSFLRLSPEVAVVTNIDNDHLDHYLKFENLKDAFAAFTHKIPFFGVAILCADDRWVAKLAAGFEKRLMTYGENRKARLRFTNLKSGEPGSQNSSQNFRGQTFDVELDGTKLGSIQLPVPGLHNVLNSLASVAVGLELKIPFEQIAHALGRFQGVDRRLQKKGELDGAIIIDDYGHHPTEVAATLEALKQSFPKRRLVVAFQPHRYSRTKECWNQFTTCFKKADLVGILDIYSAGEAKLKGIDSEKLSRAVSKKQKNVFYWGSVQTATKLVKPILRESDIFLTLGAGDVWKVGQGLLHK